MQAHEQLQVWQLKVTQAEQNDIFYKDVMGKLRQEKDGLIATLEVQVAKVTGVQSELSSVHADRSASDRKHAEEIAQFKTEVTSLTRQIEAGHESVRRLSELQTKFDQLQSDHAGVQAALAQVTAHKDQLSATVAELSVHVEASELVIHELRTKCDVATTQAVLVQTNSRQRSRTGCCHASSGRAVRVQRID
jgi:chromosome segregation ATPase